MTTRKKSLNDFLENLNFGIEFYDVYGDDELYELAEDFIKSYEIQLQNDCDYWNSQNDDGHYYCDLASEQADAQVDIYNYELRKKAGVFSEFIEEALCEFGYDKTRGIIGTFQLGQDLYYSRVSGHILSELGKYVSG